MKTRPLDVEKLRKLLVYDETSKTCLRWIHNNKVAGGLTKRSGYYNFSLDGVPTLVSRTIMVIFGYDIQDKEVDHIDGNRQNNKRCNLRVVDKATNRKNSCKRSNNITGIVGVSITNGLYYTACARIGGVNVKVHFSIKKHGDTEALNLATKERLKMINKLVENGQPYTQRHIKGE